MKTADLVHVRVMGGFQVRLADGTVAGPWVRPSARRLVQVLALRVRRRIGREELAALLFPELAPERAANSVSKALSMARAALAPYDLVKADRDVIWLEGGHRGRRRRPARRARSGDGDAAQRGARCAPRGVVPIYFSWTGEEVVFGTPPTAPKIKALTADPRVAITIDTDAFPAHVLMMRGAATVQVQDGVVAEYAAAVCRYWGEEAGNAWVAGLEAQPGMTMARVAVRPDWVALLDFQTRLPSALGGVIG